MIFQNRLTQIVFNDYLPGVVQPWIALERRASEMCRSKASVVSNMVPVPGVGWQLRSYSDSPGDRRYYTAASGGWLSTSVGAVVADHYFEEDTYGQDGVSSYSPLVQSSGAPMIRGKRPAGVPVSAMTLASDQASFPGPNASTDPVTMNRVYTFGGLEPWDDLTFDLFLPESVVGAKTKFATIYFDGPAGVDPEGAADASKEGTGHMAVELWGTGQAYLSELLVNNSWKSRMGFSWLGQIPLPVHETMLCFKVLHRMWQDADGKYQGDRLVFPHTPMTTGFHNGGLIETKDNALLNAFQLGGSVVTTYTVPRVKVKGLPSGTETTIRLDLAQDCDAMFAAIRHVYLATGYLFDDYLPFEQALTAHEAIYIYVEGTIPTGTNIAVEAFDQDGNVLNVETPLTVVQTARGQTAVASFTPTTRQRAMRVKISATSSSDRKRTPTIVRYEVDRAPVYQTENPLELVDAPQREAPPALPRTSLDTVAIHPQETDPGAENADIVIADFTGELSFLSERTMVPVLIRTRYDSNPAHWADLFRGSVLVATADERRGSEEEGYRLKTIYSLQCVGEWASASETLVPARKTWGADPNTGEYWKVTDVVRFNACLVYPPEMVAVPDVDVKLLTLDENAYLQEANGRVIDAMSEMSADYLGAYMIFDEAAGTKGKLRMLQQKAAPYNNLAVFEMDHPTVLHGDGVPRLPHWAAAYPSVTMAGQEVPSTFIQAGTYNHWLEKAEGNCVVVYGSAIGDDGGAAGGAEAGLLCQVALHTGSFNFLGLAPGDAGYPDGSSPEFRNKVVQIRCVDFKLGSQMATDWKCRRIFEKACFARFHMAFDAPLMLVGDSTDPEQVRPRRLRFYDPVLVRQRDGSLRQFMVVSCSPSYRKDGMQMARYVLVTQSNIDTIGAIDRSSSVLLEFKKAFGRIQGVNWKHAPPVGSQQRQGEHSVSRLMGLPSPTSLPIQDLDPTSSTFGQFVNMADYDLIPFAA